jgi:uncharacterized membrane-anchored protein YitT (DUF2179 family)
MGKKFKVGGKRYTIHAGPTALVVCLILVIVGIVFFAPAENAAAALSGSSVLALVVQALARQAVTSERADASKTDAAETVVGK